jgi:hypothetical protein
VFRIGPVRDEPLDGGTGQRLIFDEAADAPLHLVSRCLHEAPVDLKHVLDTQRGEVLTGSGPDLCSQHFEAIEDSKSLPLSMASLTMRAMCSSSPAWYSSIFRTERICHS